MSMDLQKWWTQLLTQDPTNEDLRYIIRYVPALREQAEAMLTTPSLKELMDQLKRS